VIGWSVETHSQAKHSAIGLTRSIDGGALLNLGQIRLLPIPVRERRGSDWKPSHKVIVFFCEGIDDVRHSAVQSLFGALFRIKSKILENWI
jgi:hypothetical protein